MDTEIDRDKSLQVNRCVVFRQLDLSNVALAEGEYDQSVETDPKKIARLLRRGGFPVRYNEEAGLYVNSIGDAYADGIVESEFARIGGK